MIAWDPKLELHFLSGSVVSSLFFLEFSGVLVFSAHCFLQNSLQIKRHFFFLRSPEISRSKGDCRSQIWDVWLSISSFDHSVFKHKLSCVLHVRLHHCKLLYKALVSKICSRKIGAFSSSLL